MANRNFLIHQYDEINRELTWEIPEADLPQWRDALQQLFEEAVSVIDARPGDTDQN